jgi:hypothetical protein
LGSRTASPLIAGLAAAALTALPGPARSETVGYFEAGPEYLDGQAYASVEPGLQYESEALRLSLAVPLRLRLNSSLTSRDGLLRTEDWDDLSDAGRVLRRFELQLAQRAFTLHLGALAHATIGHGTIVNGLASSLDPDSLPLGAQARVVVGALAVDLLGSDLFAPGVVGASATLEPLSLWGEVNDRLHLSLSLIADPSAPQPSGFPRATVYGAGLDLAVLRTREVRIAPYFDANGRGKGFGLHAGVLADLSLGPAELGLKAEWRRTSGSYLPDYFDIAYSIERLSYLTSDPRPKAGVDGGTFNSWRGEMRLVAGPVTVAAALAGREQERWDGSLVLSTAIGPLDLAAFAALRSFTWGNAPDRLYLLAEGRYRLGSYLYLWAMGGQLERLEGSSGGEAAEPSLQAAMGIGIAAAP